METIIDNKHSMEQVMQITSNPNKSSCFEQSPKYDDEVSLGVD